MPRSDLQSVSTLVTGGAGFIGSHLVDALLAQGAQVRVLDNFATGRHVNLVDSSSRIELVVGDVRDPEICERACEGVEVVFHQAALGSVPRSLTDPATTIAVNVQGTANVLAAARRAGSRRVVYASSSSVYGDSAELPKTVGQEGRPLSPYAASKQMNEQLGQIFASAYGLQMVGLRYFNIYGPRQDPEGPYAAVIPRFFKAFLSGGAPTIYGDGEQSRDFTFVEDAARANLLAARPGFQPGETGSVFNVAAGEGVSVNRLARMARRLTESRLEAIHEAPRAGDVRHSLADLEASRAELDFEPETSLEEGLAECIDYYRSLLGASSGSEQEDSDNEV